MQWKGQDLNPCTADHCSGVLVFLNPFAVIVPVRILGLLSGKMYMQKILDLLDRFPLLFIAVCRCLPMKLAITSLEADGL